MIQSANPFYVVDVFQDWVRAVDAKLPFDVHSQYGHITEILENMSQLDRAGQSSFKYPCVILICDFQERMNALNSGYGKYFEAKLNILIANTTERTFKSNQRMEQVFKPILYPIYQELMVQIRQSPFTDRYGNSLLPHTKIDRLFFGRESIHGNKANTLNDYVDVIEIKDLTVRLINNYCKPLK